MAQQTCLDARVCVFLQALDFLHQSNYIKKGGFHTVLSYYMQLNCAWMCNHSRWGPFKFNYQLCRTMPKTMPHVHSSFAVVPWGCFQVSPKIFSFCGMKDDWREDLDDPWHHDDWWWLTQLFFPVILQVLSVIYSWQKDAKTGNYFLKQSSLFKLVN